MLIRLEPHGSVYAGMEIPELVASGGEAAESCVVARFGICDGDGVRSQ